MNSGVLRFFSLVLEALNKYLFPINYDHVWLHEGGEEEEVVGYSLVFMWVDKITSSVRVSQSPVSYSPPQQQLNRRSL